MGAFFCSSKVSDSGLNFLRKNAKAAALLSATVSNLAGCTAATYLARNTTISSANFTLGDDSTNVGRKITMSSMSTLPVNSTGDATCLVLYNTAVGAGATGLFYYTKCSVNLASTNNSVSVQNWKITILDPTS